MSSTGQAEALQRRLLVRVAAAGCLLVVGLGTLAWLAQDAPPPIAPKPAAQALAPHVGAITLATKPIEAEMAVKLEAAPLPDTVVIAERPSEPSISGTKPQGAATSVSGEIVQTAETGSAAADPSAAAKKALAPPKEKLPRGPHLQAGVFAQAANAQELKAKLEAEGLPVYIESRVQIGPFKNRKEAEAMREKLKADGVATVLIAQ